MKKDIKSTLLYILLGLVIGVMIKTIVWSTVDNNQINFKNYQFLEELKEDTLNPEFKALLKESLTDFKITNAEFKKLIDKSDISNRDFSTSKEVLLIEDLLKEETDEISLKEYSNVKSWENEFSNVPPFVTLLKDMVSDKKITIKEYKDLKDFVKYMKQEYKKRIYLKEKESLLK